jgi:hypothetical protein
MGRAGGEGDVCGEALPAAALCTGIMSAAIRFTIRLPLINLQCIFPPEVPRRRYPVLAIWETGRCASSSPWVLAVPGSGVSFLDVLSTADCVDGLQTIGRCT